MPARAARRAWRAVGALRNRGAAWFLLDEENMRQRMVWRYWCEFCGKGGCAKGHMAKHESRCIKNPNRVCGMCRIADNKQASVLELAALCRRTDIPGQEIAKELRRLTRGCPACTLSAIVASGRSYDVTEEIGTADSWGCRETKVVLDAIPFDYKQAKEAFWKALNEDRVESYY